MIRLAVVLVLLVALPGCSRERPADCPDLRTPAIVKPTPAEPRRGPGSALSRLRAPWVQQAPAVIPAPAKPPAKVAPAPVPQKVVPQPEPQRETKQPRRKKEKRKKAKPRPAHPPAERPRESALCRGVRNRNAFERAIMRSMTVEQLRGAAQERGHRLTDSQAKQVKECAK